MIYPIKRNIKAIILGIHLILLGIGIVVLAFKTIFWERVSYLGSQRGLHGSGVKIEKVWVCLECILFTPYITISLSRY